MSKKNRRQQAAKKSERLTKPSNSARSIFIAVIAVIVLALGGVGYLLVKESQKTHLTDFEGPTPSVANEHGGVPFGVVDGQIRAGYSNDDDETPVNTVSIYADFLCPACADFEKINSGEIEEIILSEQATIAYHPVSILDNSPDNTGFSSLAANAFLEVAEAAPEHALAFMEILFIHQPEDGVMQNEEMRQLGLDIGVPEEAMERFDEFRFQDWIEAAKKQATRDGMKHTPSTALNGEFVEISWSEYGSLSELAFHKGR